MIVTIRWRVKGLPVVITKDSEVWQEPFETGLNYYGWRKIEPHIHMGSIHYRIRGKRHSERKLKDLAYEVNKKINIPMPDKEDLPF